MIPHFSFTLEMPEPLSSARSFLRLHNRVAKDALREEAINHWQKRIPGHFQDSARQKYGHMPRKPGYVAWKRRVFGRETDLVMKGRTRAKMTRERPEIRLGGSAEKGAINLTMTLRFPFGVAAQRAIAKKARQGIRHTGPRSTGVTIAQMRSEISKIIPDEQREIAAGFLARYTKLLNAGLKGSPRIRRRVGSMAA